MIPTNKNRILKIFSIIVIILSVGDIPMLIIVEKLNISNNFAFYIRFFWFLPILVLGVPTFLISLAVKYSGRTEVKKREKFNRITKFAVIFSIAGDSLIVILWFFPYRDFLKILTLSISIISIILIILGITNVKMKDERMNLTRGLPGVLLGVNIIFLCFVLLPLLFPVYGPKVKTHR